MTWEEAFYDDGQVELCDGGTFAENRTPDQMYQIMKALK